ncbi:SDR family NAD(P)-dependent oxidoreductase [Phenylobacterium sp. LjRoot219]|uniref:SDR family NAD(P)-dependent oxidoreductase n=1 Tax=Phenylobacterium sp. LjRoot219 TaxID=3342283 RepID=UPI003ECD4144
MSLNGKVAVVTGAARGLGKAIALQLATDGAAIAVWDLDGAGAEATAAEITEAGGRAIGFAADCADAAVIAQAAARTRAELGPITVLVNNAGMTGFVPFQQTTEELWDRMMKVNLKGPFLCTQEILPDMLAAGWGRIVNISSSSAQTGAPVMSAYASSKGGVIAFTKAMAIEFADKGITVNNIPPGFVDTPMLREGPVDVDAAAKASPMKRPGRPEDIAAACSYLCSEAAGYVTGQTLGVNGGRVIY